MMRSIQFVFLIALCILVEGISQEIQQDFDFYPIQVDYVESNKIELVFILRSSPTLDTLVVPGSPWVREGWDSSRVLYYPDIHTENNFPYVQIVDKSIPGHFSINRRYLFSGFKSFVTIFPNKPVRFRIILNIRDNFLRSFDYNLSLWINLPYMDLKKFMKHNVSRHIITSDEMVNIELVKPEYFQYTSENIKEVTISFSDVFEKRIAYSGVIRLKQ